MKKSQLEKELSQAGKELRLIAEGMLMAQDADEYIAELQGKHGGARAGSGKKSALRKKYPNEIKKPVTLRMYPSQLKEIEIKYGSLQKAVDRLD
jgi:hypothetical protein